MIDTPEIHSSIDRKEKTTEVIYRLVHEIQNELQVISMEANPQHEPRYSLGAVKKIERLLREVQQSLMLPR